MRLKVERRKDGWWITGLPEGFDDCGAYKTKGEANEAKQGIQGFLDNHDKPGFVTSKR
jgi:hypothetical protein